MQPSHTTVKYSSDTNCNATAATHILWTFQIRNVNLNGDIIYAGKKERKKNKWGATRRPGQILILWYPDPGIRHVLRCAARDLPAFALKDHYK